MYNKYKVKNDSMLCDCMEICCNNNINDIADTSHVGHSNTLQNNDLDCNHQSSMVGTCGRLVWLQ